MKSPLTSKAAQKIGHGGRIIDAYRQCSLVATHQTTRFHLSITLNGPAGIQMDGTGLFVVGLRGFGQSGVHRREWKYSKEKGGMPITIRENVSKNYSGWPRKSSSG
jgi:hypothetical protein